jgi:hypothetical protein
MCALRMRVNKSAIGSLYILGYSVRLPGALDDTRDLAGEGAFPEADAAQLKAANVPPRPAAELAAVAHAHGVFALELAVNT